MAHVFLSHNSADKDQVRRLARELQDRGVEVWLDERELHPGSWLAAGIHDAIQKSAVVLACVGLNGKGPWQERELEAARLLALDVQLAVLPGWSADRGLLGLEARRGYRLYENWRYEIEVLARNLSKRAPRVLPENTVQLLCGPFSGCPYPGLDSAFEPEHAPWFFGRERETQRLLEKLLEHRWVWLVGNSGAGKSSLARAGVMASWPEGLQNTFAFVPYHRNSLEVHLKVRLKRDGSELTSSEAAQLRDGVISWTELLEASQKGRLEQRTV